MKKDFNKALFFIGAILFLSVFISCKHNTGNNEDSNTYTVEDFLEAINTDENITEITADSTKTGITISNDGKTANIYGVSITGAFSLADNFPSYLVNADLTGLDTSKITSMRGMFLGCSKLKTLDLSSFDTSNVTDTSEMFYQCRNISIKYGDKWTFTPSETFGEGTNLNWFRK